MGQSGNGKVTTVMPSQVPFLHDGLGSGAGFVVVHEVCLSLYVKCTSNLDLSARIALGPANVVVSPIGLLQKLVVSLLRHLAGFCTRVFGDWEMRVCCWAGP